MDELLDKAGTVLLGLGLPGVVILALCFAVYKVFILYCVTQEKRIAESTANLETVKNLNNSIEKLTTTVDTLARALQR